MTSVCMTWKLIVITYIMLVEGWGGGGGGGEGGCHVYIG